MSMLSMWAIQRDNGGCPGSTGANNCSGIVQTTWDFSHTLKGVHPAVVGPTVPQTPRKPTNSRA